MPQATEPPAASIAAFAPSVAATPFRLTARVSAPDRITFAPSASCGTTPAAFSTSRSTSPPSRRSRSDRRTSAVSPALIDLKPRLGSRRCSGICPPLKPTLWKPPERDFCPLCPRPAVFPRPEPMPRPTRLRACVLPSAGLSSFSFISVHPDEVRHLADHAAHGRRVFQFARLVDLLQAQAQHGRAMRAARADGALHQGHLHHLLAHRALHAPAPRASAPARAQPKIS